MARAWLACSALDLDQPRERQLPPWLPVGLACGAYQCRKVKTTSLFSGHRTRSSASVGCRHGVRWLDNQKPRTPRLVDDMAQPRPIPPRLPRRVLPGCRFRGRLRKRKIKHAKPVTAAIVLWNTVYLERATSALRAHGKALDDTLLQYLSPLGWEHINLTGDYLWRSSAKVGAGKFRPLRPLPPA